MIAAYHYLIIVLQKALRKSFSDITRAKNANLHHIMIDNDSGLFLILSSRGSLKLGVKDINHDMPLSK
jgi:hypothetical protein